MTPPVSTSFVFRGHRERSYNVSVTGPLDRRTANSLRFVLRDLECDHVTIDLTECTLVTDGALDALVGASQIAEESGGELRLHRQGAR